MNHEENKYKIIVFHPMKQHSYKTAEALANNNLLFSYCTSIYYNPQKLIYKLLNLILSSREKKKMFSHTNPTLDKYVKTLSTFYGFMYLLIGRLDKSKKAKYVYKMQDILTRKMGKQVARYAIKNQVDAIIGYDTWSYGAIAELKKRNSKIKFIVDYTSFYPEEILSIIESDIAKNPAAKDSYSKSLEKFKPKYINYFKYEKDYCNYCFSPSLSVDESLIKYGKPKTNILRCTLGTYFKKSDKVKKTSDHIVFTYIGRISYAKGIHYLIEAFQKLNSSDYTLELVGSNTDNINLDLNNKQIKYLGVKHHDEIPNILENADVFVTASLYDGFSFAIVEALSHNVPAICTEKTGVKDYIKDGINGYVVKDSSSEALAKVIENLLNNKNIIDKMKNNIKNTTLELTWDNYNHDIVNAIKKIF